MQLRGQRSVFTTRRHAAYPALTYAFSIGPDRGLATDDSVRRIIARLCDASRLSNRLTRRAGRRKRLRAPCGARKDWKRAPLSR